jgi:hypothetical protein
MKNLFVALSLLLTGPLGFALGCGGRTSIDYPNADVYVGTDAAVESGGGSIEAGADPTADCRPYTSPLVCSQNPSGEVVTQTLDAFRAAISARWLLCGRQSIFAVKGGDIGLEITVEGRWYKLYAARGGGTVRGAGFDEEGTWEAITVPRSSNDAQPFQLDFSILGSGAIYTHPALAGAPSAMRLHNGVLRGDYVLDQTVPVGIARCPPGSY